MMERGCLSLGHTLPLCFALLIEASLVPTCFLALRGWTPRTEVAMNMAHNCCMPYPSVHCLGNSLKMQMPKCFVFLICILSTVAGEVRPHMNGMWTGKPVKDEFLQFCQFFQVVYCTSLRIICIATEAGA